METNEKVIGLNAGNYNLKKGAKLALIILLLNVVFQLAAVYQTRYQLASPLIPDNMIWQVNKEFIFHAMVSAIASIIVLLFYFFDKYLFVIILVTMVLIADRLNFV